MKNETSGRPILNWIKNDPAKHQIFEMGDKYLIAVPVKTKFGPDYDLAVVTIGSNFGLEFACVCPYDDWVWEDVEWFVVLEGSEPQKYEKDLE